MTTLYSMNADSLSLLVILRQELEEIAKSLEPKCEIMEDIMTDNGLNIDGNVNDNDDNNNNDNNGASDDDHEEEEKAQELQCNPNIDKLDHNQIGKKIEDLIENYLTPTIKQLNKKGKKRKKLELIDNTKSSPFLYQSPSYHHQHNVNNNDNESYSKSASALLSSSLSSLTSEPGQVIDEMSNLSEKCGGCCRKFITSCFCGCGVFQTLSVMFVFLIFATIFIFYRATEITLILRELNHWKELSVKRIEYELSSQQKLAEINFDLDVDIDKMKQEHKHRQYLELIEAKKSLTKEFIDKNTRTVTTTYWNFLTTETETVTQTIFSQDDIDIFQNNILYFGFNSDHAIDDKAHIQQQQQEDNQNVDIDNNHHDDDSISNSKATCSSSSDDNDSFDAI